MHPFIADFGLMGPMLRHIGQDPSPAEIMRNEGPAVFDWVSRVWNAGGTEQTPPFLDSIPKDATSMLTEIAETHLVQLQHNAIGFSQGNERFEMEIQGCHYQNLPVSRYRLWCLEQLREAFARLSPADQAEGKGLLPFEAAAIIWEDNTHAPSDHDTEEEAPL
ncbi:MAG: hypothetical protein ACI8Z1_002072 [Candidatus Azotimanducaceae bacterium]|jgi:hypothetical protein